MNCIWMEVVPAVCFEFPGADLTTWSTVVIALFTVGLFIWQWRFLSHARMVADVNYKFSLHDKRLRVYMAFREYMQHSALEGRPTREVIRSLLDTAAEVPFIFGDEIDEHLKRVLEISFKYRIAEQRIANLEERKQRGGLSETEKKKWNEQFKLREELEEELFNRFQGNALEDIFRPYLKLPISLNKTKPIWLVLRPKRQAKTSPSRNRFSF